MLDHIRSFLSLIFAITTMYTLLDCSVKIKKNLIKVLLFFAILLTVDGVFIFYLGYNRFMNFYPLLIQLPVMVGFMFVSNFKPIKVFFIHWTMVAITTSFSLVGLIVSYFFESNHDIVNIVCFIFYFPTWLVIYKYMRPSFLYMMRHTNKGWLGFCIIPICYSILLYSAGNYNFDKPVTVSAIRSLTLLFIITLSAYYLIIQYFKRTIEQLTLENEQDLLRTQVTAAKHHLEALAESQEKTIYYRHDMHHHLNLINSYLTDNNLAAAQKYIASVENSIENTVVKKYCNNYTVNLILSSYIAKAQTENITIETRIDLPENNFVSDMDLCVIFSNALENAIIACCSIEVEKDRIIKIVTIIKNDKLFIQITNSFYHQIVFVDDMPVSNRENHGTGTKSIAAIAQKYGGIYSFSANEKIFEASIIL